MRGAIVGRSDCHPEAVHALMTNGHLSLVLVLVLVLAAFRVVDISWQEVAAEEPAMAFGSGG
jgi:hypothetical protein